MKDFWTWRKVALFLGIIGLGIVGLVIADRQDFLSGRANSQTAIGNGEPDPLAKDADILPIKTKSNVTATQKSSIKTQVPVKNEPSDIDGINPVVKSKK